MKSSLRRPGPTPINLPVRDRLNSWKEIAVHLDTSVRTVQRWELSEGLPIHRHEHSSLGTVYAFTAEIDAWLESRRSTAATQPPPARKPPSRVIGLAVAAAVLASAIIWFWVHRPAPQPRLAALTASSGVESAPAFSPDGRRVAYSWKQEGEEFASLYIRLIGAGDPLRLTTRRPAFQPAWSPDGRYIAFYGDPPGIYLVPSLGGAERKLTAVDAGRTVAWFPGRMRPTWFADSNRLAFADLDPAAGALRIFEFSMDSGERRQLTFGPSHLVDWRPSVSPDGKTLAFLRSRAPAAVAVFVMPASGGEPRRLTRFEDWAFDFAWTADSHEIVYCVDQLGFSTLWRIHASGGTPRRVAEVGFDIREPAIAPSESRMAFTRPAAAINLWRFHLDRQDPPGIVAATTRLQLAPQFSPDGKRLAFESNRSGSGEIWTSDSDGMHLTQLTSLGHAAAGSPRWSPDGTEIAFDARPGGNADVFVTNALGGAPRRITTTPADDVVPSFSRDGRWIYFASNRSGEYQIWKAPRHGGDAVQLTRGGGVGPVESPDAKYVYFSRHFEQTELWRIPTAGGPESPVLKDVPQFRWKSWAITPLGLLYISPDSNLHRIDPQSSRATPLAKLPALPIDFTISPDERILVYSKREQSSSNIMLLENFR